jgi:hypothetical protein
MPKKQSSPPEEPKIKTESEVLDLNKPDFVFIPEGRHTWRQEGPYLVCRSCILHHAVHVGMNKIMVGEDEDGQPILRERSELNLAS